MNHKGVLNIDAILTGIVSLSDATSITPVGETAEINQQINTQAAGTLTINAPSGSITNGKKLILAIQTTNIQTLSWNSSYQGSTDLPLTSASSGSSKWDYFGFIYNSTSGKWNLLAKTMGFS